MRTATFSRTYVNGAVLVSQLRDAGGEDITVTETAVFVLFDRQCFDAAGYHEGYESLYLSIPLVHARPEETFPPTAWRGIVDAPALYPSDVVADIGAAKIESLDCPHEAYYDLEEGQDEDDQELRYAPLTEYEAWEILVPECIRFPDDPNVWGWEWAFVPTEPGVEARWVFRRTERT